MLPFVVVVVVFFVANTLAAAIAGGVASNSLIIRGSIPRAVYYEFVRCCCLFRAAPTTKIFTYPTASVLANGLSTDQMGGSGGGRVQRRRENNVAEFFPPIVVKSYLLWLLHLVR